MRYKSGRDFLADPHKTIAFMGLSGVGKTTVMQLLPTSQWFQYNVDYRIWTYQLSDTLNDYLKSIAMKLPQLKQLLLQDAITLTHKVHFNNLQATSAYMGMLGKKSLGGASERAFRQRMEMYSQAEVAVMLEAPRFIARSRTLYQYPHFTLDASGSLCEIVDPDDPHDPVLTMLESHALVIYIQATPEHIKQLMNRQKRAPKPIYYRPDFLDVHIPRLLEKHHAKRVEDLSPLEVATYLYPALIKHRIPRYEALAKRLGYTIPMDNVAHVKTQDDLLTLLANSIDNQK